jgi:hypothetical protein
MSNVNLQLTPQHIVGGDASDHAIAVYGNIGQQHAMPAVQGNDNNQIARNMPNIGGRRTRASRNSMMIPTVLLVSNTNCSTIKRRTNKRKMRKGGKSRKSGKSGKSRKSRKSRK